MRTHDRGTSAFSLYACTGAWRSGVRIRRGRRWHYSVGTGNRGIASGRAAALCHCYGGRGRHRSRSAGPTPPRRLQLQDQKPETRTRTRMRTKTGTRTRTTTREEWREPRTPEKRHVSNKLLQRHPVSAPGAQLRGRRPGAGELYGTLGFELGASRFALRRGHRPTWGPTGDSLFCLRPSTLGFANAALLRGRTKTRRRRVCGALAWQGRLVSSRGGRCEEQESARCVRVMRGLRGALFLDLL